MPSLIVEVASKGTHKTDYVDKYLDYTQIPSLQHYIIAEPEMLLVTVLGRSGEAWVAGKYTRRDEVMALPLPDVQLHVSALYPAAD